MFSSAADKNYNKKILHFNRFSTTIKGIIESHNLTNNLVVINLTEPATLLSQVLVSADKNDNQNNITLF